jgi:uncharacterized DUF497 family protein
VDISFDAAKNARNIATRGISFEQAVDFEWDTALIVADTRKDYGESREFTAPALGNKPNLVTIAAILPANANGVLYKLGANSGGLTLFVEDGILCYEYNLFIIMRTKIRATQKLPVGKAKIEVETVYVEPKPGGPLKVTLKVNGKQFATGVVPVSAPLLFTANDCLDIGIALGSPVSLDYHKKVPFKFTGTIDKVNVKYIPQPTK